MPSLAKTSFVALAFLACLQSPRAEGEDEFQGHSRRPAEHDATEATRGDEHDVSGERTIVIRSSVLGGDDTAGFSEMIRVEHGQVSAEGIGDIVGRAAGVYVRSVGGMGEYGVASIRGADPEQVPVYLDGVLLNLGGFTAVNLAEFAPEAIGSVEVFRGQVPARLARGGFSGAVVLHTRKERAPVIELRAGAGSWAGWHASALGAARPGPWSLLAVVSAVGSRGDFIYLNRNGTLFDTSDDVYMPRSNNSHRTLSALVKAERPMGEDWRLELAADTFWRKQGVAGLDNLPTTNTWLSSFRQTLQARTITMGDWWSAGVDANFYLVRQEFDDSAAAHGELGLGRQHVLTTDWTAGCGGWFDYSLGRHSASARLEAGFENFSHRDLIGGAAPGDKRLYLLVLAYTHQWRPWEGWALEPGARIELRYASFGGGPLPGGIGRMDAVAEFEPVWQASLGYWRKFPGGFRLVTSAGHTARPAGLAELFGDRGAVVGNPNLKPESAWRADIGGEWRRDWPSIGLGVETQAAVFGSFADDLIVYVQNSQASVRPENIDSAVVAGFETAAHAYFPRGWKLDLSYTYMFTTNLSQSPVYRGNRLPGRPAHRLWARLSWEWKAARHDTVLWFEADYAGSNYLDAANLKQDTLARLLFGAGLSIEHDRSGLLLSLRVQNLADTIVVGDGLHRRPLRDFEGFPLPGLTVMATVGWRASIDDGRGK